MKARKEQVRRLSPVGLSLNRRCNILAVPRSSMYYKAIARPDETELANRLGEIYQAYPMYGYRRLRACLNREGIEVNGKRLLRLMRLMGLRAIYPGPQTTVRAAEGRKAPYLLKDMALVKAHEAWQVDITYLRTDKGFLYLTALIDCATRYVVGWSLDNTLDVRGCLRALEQALMDHPTPEVINSDQGRQFTSAAWQDVLQKQPIQISMSGKGRSNDNGQIERLWRTLKWEWLFINGARTVGDYKKLLPLFMTWYNQERPHQALGYQTPVEVLARQCGMPLGGKEDKAHALSPTAPKARVTNTLLF